MLMGQIEGWRISPTLIFLLYQLLPEKVGSNEATSFSFCPCYLPDREIQEASFTLCLQLFRARLSDDINCHCSIDINGAVLIYTGGGAVPLFSSGAMN